MKTNLVRSAKKRLEQVRLALALKSVHMNDPDKSSNLLQGCLDRSRNFFNDATVRFRLYAVLVLLCAIIGCAGTRAPISAREAHRYDGRLVDAVTLTDGTIVQFDPWESAGRGPDKRGRIRGDAIVGYVDGLPTRVALEHVEEIRLGVDDSSAAQVTTLIGVAAMVGAALFVVLIVALRDFNIE